MHDKPLFASCESLRNGRKIVAPPEPEAFSATNVPEYGVTHQLWRIMSSLPSPVMSMGVGQQQSPPLR